MRTKAYYQGASKSLAGELIVSFAIEDEEAIAKLEKDKDKMLVLEIERFSDKRSLNANAYFWVLCDRMAKVLKTTKEKIYHMQLSRYGVFVDMQIIKEALPLIKTQFRYVDEFPEDEIGDSSYIRCYIGSSHYNREEMARLIDGTVEDAKELGIDTWTPDEIERAIAAWEGD